MNLRNPALTAPRAEAGIRAKALSFVAADVSLLTPINAMERVVEEQDVILVPTPGPGLVGLLRLEQLLVPLYDLGAYAYGLTPPARQGDFLLTGVMQTPHGWLAIRLQRMLGLVSMSDYIAEENQSVTQLPAVLQRCFGGALCNSAGQAYLFLPELFAEQLILVKD